MPNYEAQFQIWPVSNLQEDAATNVWSIIADDDAAAEDGVAGIIAFYEDIYELYGTLTRQNNHTVKLYRRADPIPRAPIFTDTWDFPVAPTGDTMPTEVSMCLSFQGDQVSGEPQARRRGRVYIGPIAEKTLGTDGRPTGTYIGTLRDAGAALLSASTTALDWSWSVFSPTEGSGVEITNGWVDNEYDTQRRRGRKATSRSTF